MGRMAGDAAHVALSMQRVDRIHVLGSTGMTRQAAVADVFGRMILEVEDLRYVAPSGNVSRPRTMATFAAMMGWTSVRIKRCLPVRGLLPSLVDILVAGHTDFRSYIAGSRRVLRLRRSLGGIVRLCCDCFVLDRRRGLRVFGTGSRTSLWRGNEDHYNTGIKRERTDRVLYSLRQKFLSDRFSRN
jgi:hypothetical protein